MKPSIHSITDLITNSSTTIFTRSDDSLKACKDLIDEFLKTFGINKTCDDLFNLVVLFEDNWSYDYNLPENVSKEQFDKLYKDVKQGKEQKPDWFYDIEKSKDESSTTLFITAKEEKYKHIADKLEKFLYSTSSDETSE
jgi:hypothetical protein